MNELNNAWNAYQASLRRPPLVSDEKKITISDTIFDAMLGQRGPEQQRLAEQGLAWIELLLQKNHDYGSSVFKPPVLAKNLELGSAILVRMSDKISRLESLQNRTGEVVESFDDTIRDLGAYCLLYLARPR
jgi:hypothetical protein